VAGRRLDCVPPHHRRRRRRRLCRPGRRQGGGGGGGRERGAGWVAVAVGCSRGVGEEGAGELPQLGLREGGVGGGTYWSKNLTIGRVRAGAARAAPHLRNRLPISGAANGACGAR
jgi:hypothetical protein